MKEKKAEEERLKHEEEELQKRKLEEKQERKQRKKEKKRIVYDEKIGGGDSDYSDVTNEVNKEEIFKQPANANQIWTDVDLAKLTKLIKKYPAGTPERWERIADIMERLPMEVTKMAKKMKDNSYIIPTATTQGNVDHNSISYFQYKYTHSRL